MVHCIYLLNLCSLSDKINYVTDLRHDHAADVVRFVGTRHDADGEPPYRLRAMGNTVIDRP
jgi:hypothetical protein